jgi:hypothetical protein
MALPQASVSDKDAKALLNKQRQAELAGLTGIAKVNRQVDFDLQDMGRDGPDNSVFAKRWRQAAVDDYNNTQNVAAAQKAKADATREAEKADRDAASQAQRYASKIEDLTIAIEVQKVRASEVRKRLIFTPPHTRAALNGQPNRLRKFVSRPQSGPLDVTG